MQAALEKSALSLVSATLLLAKDVVNVNEDEQENVQTIRVEKSGNEDKVEGRRKRAEREQRQKEEEEELRNCEMRSKRKEQRDNVVSELVVTEQEFARDLKLTYEVFHLHDPQYLLAKGVDGTALFGNILEVIRLSEDIADKLYRSLKEKQREEVAVGQCFLQLQSEFQKVYETYCTNYDDAQTLLEKYESNPETLKFFTEGIEILRQKIACFNMGSVLIKPVQRILKYPLILGELMKCTDESSPDKQNLEEALTVMTKVATHINESKRKKEIIQKYLANNNGEGTVGRRVSRISLHSVAKKSSRLGMILKSSLGIAPTTKDSAFDALESRFSELVHGVSAVLRDVSALCEQLKSMLQLQLSVSEAFASFYGEKNRDPLVDHFRTTQRNILLQHWSTFDSYILQFVTGPLIALSEAFQGPELLVQKRRDKLLDFDIAVEKLSKNRDPSQQRTLQEEENVARNTYVALNSQLLEQLPKLIEHGYLIYKRCLSSFVYARKLLVGRATKELLELVDKPQIARLHGEIVDDFSVAHSRAAEKLAAISFFSKSFKSLFLTSNQEPAVSPKTALRKNSGKIPFAEGSMTVQSRETVTLLKSKYKSEDLYMVTGRCDVKEALDLAANPGLVVAVIKREDPMGRTERWLVDAGDVRGFLLAKNLTPLPSSSARPASTVSLTESVGSSTDFSKDKTSVEDTSEPSSASRFYDDPPTYEEAGEMAALSTMEEYSNEHRYCDIAERDYEKVEDGTNPIYVDIDEVAASVKEFTVTEVFFAAYSFEARSPLEVDISEGEAVRIIQKCDEGGNPEWWLVETESGKRGYAPAAYLKPL